MKVAIITDLLDNELTSRGKYTENLVRELLEIPKDKQVEIILIHGERKNLDVYKKAREVIVPSLKQKKQLSFPIKVLFRIFHELRTTKIIKVCKNEKVHIVYIPHLGRSPGEISTILFMNNIIVTNHGMANLALPSKLCYGKNLSVKRLVDYVEFLKWRFIFKNKFDYLITVSHSEKRNISKNLGIPPEKIKVIYHGVDHKNCELKRKLFKKILYQKYRIDFPFIFHLSAYQPKKNVENIIKAFAVAKKYKIKEKLVVGGKQPTHLKRLAKELGIENDVVFVGFIPEEDLSTFYGVAEAFIFPSFHESFGMPILEAMACGCPVITSNVFSMPEVAGKAAILVNPYNTKEIAEAIYMVVTNKKLKRKLVRWGLERAKKFTWERCAKEHLKIYNKVFNGMSR